MKASTRRRRKTRDILLFAGCAMVLGGVMFYIISPPSSIPPTKYSFKVEDSSTMQPLGGVMLSIIGIFGTQGSVPLGTVITDSNGSATLAASTRLKSIDVNRSGYQIYLARNIPSGTSYLILLGNGTSSLSLINQTSGIRLVLPDLSLPEWIGVAVVGGGVALLCAVTILELTRKRATSTNMGLARGFWLSYAELMHE